MATERTRHSQHQRDEDARATDIGDEALALPSQRVATPPPEGTDEAAFLDNLNEVYGAEAPIDDAVIEGIRRQMRAVLDATS